MEDYLEGIYRLVEERGYAHVSDIASSMGVKASSVTHMLKKLGDLNLVKYRRYHGATLTRKGKALAKSINRRHETLRSFLEALGVDRVTAEVDACQMEHQIHPETVEKLVKLVEFLQKANVSSRWLEHFRHFEKTGKHPQI